MPRELCARNWMALVVLSITEDLRFQQRPSETDGFVPMSPR